MKKVYYTLALAALLTAGCSQNDELSVIEQPNVKENALTATFDGVTRTYTTDGRNTLWSDNDIIYVGASSMGAFKLSSSGGSNTGVFLPQDGVSGELGNDFYAVYGPCTSPSKSGNTVSGFTIPSEISYTDPNCKNVIMMGKVNKDNKTVSFKNTGAILYVKIGKDIDINKVKVVANYAISGAATVDWNEDTESHEEKPVYKITDTYSEGSHDKITVTGVTTTGADNNVVIPLPQSSNAQTIKVYVQKDTETEKRIFTGSVKIERNKYYKIEYNSENDMIVNMEEGLISALNTATTKKVTMVNNVFINGNKTVNHQEELTLDMNGKDLTIAEGTTLNIELGSTSSSTNNPIYTIKNGTVKVGASSTINCSINQACTIDLQSCKFEKAGTTGEFTMNIIIPKETSEDSSIKDGEGQPTGDYLHLAYNGTLIGGTNINFGDIYMKYDNAEIHIDKTVDGVGTIHLNITRKAE